MSRSQLQCNEASGFSLIKLVSVYECVPIQNQSVFSFIQYLKVVRHKLCIKVMITMPTQTLAVIQLPRHKPLTSTTPRSWAVYLSSSMQWHWQSSWHFVTSGHVMAGVWNVNDETSYMNVHSAGWIQEAFGAACSLFLTWEERPVIASIMEFHVNVSTINNEANTDVCWKWWPIRAARQC